MSKPIVYLTPRYRTASHHICQSIYEAGRPITMEEGIALHGYKGRPIPSLMKKLYDNAVDYGWLIEKDNKYTVSKVVSNYFDGFTSVANKHSELVKPAYHPQTKEMKPVPRDQRIRDITFVTSGTVVEPVIAGWSATK